MMKRLTLSLLVVMALGIAAWAAPQITADSTTWDFGTVVSGTVLVHTFVLTNTGSDPLHISNVSTSCGCTVAQLAKSTLNPGESTNLTVTWHSAGTGDASKTVMVNSDDPIQSRLDLVLTATLVLNAPKISVDPASFDFGITSSGTELVHTFRLSNAGDQPLVISEVSTTCSCTTAGLGPMTLAPGESTDFQITYSPTGSGKQESTVTIKSNDPSPSRGTVTVSATTVPYGQIPAGTLEAKIRILVDLRSAQAYAAGHLQGAINLPQAEMASWTPNLPRGVTIIVYDQDGSQAGPVVQSLRGAGVSLASALTGGLNAWTALYGNQLVVASAARERFIVNGSTGSASLAGLAPAVAAPIVRGDFVVLVDLRSASDYAQSRLAGAVNVAPSQLLTWAVSLPKDALVVVYDASGGAASYALQLRNQGFAKAVELYGGFNAWKQQMKDRLLVAPVAR